MTHDTSRIPVALGRLLEDRFGLGGDLERLLGERDRNFRLTTNDDQSYVVKVVDADETGLESDFQIQALRHLQDKKCGVEVPRVVSAMDGEYAATIDLDGRRQLVRVVTWVEGTPMTQTEPSARFCRELGMALAAVDSALADFRHAGDRRDLIWDMQNAARLRGRAAHITDLRVRKQVDSCFDAFEKNAERRFSSIRNQVIHSDLNPANVLVTTGECPSIAGIIDFSDMVRAPLVVDVAIAASYLRSAGDDRLELISPFIAGFNSVVALEDVELELLYDLVRTRLATTITMKYWRAATVREQDPYLAQTMDIERDAEIFLARTGELSGRAFQDRIRADLSEL